MTRYVAVGLLVLTAACGDSTNLALYEQCRDDVRQRLSNPEGAVFSTFQDTSASVVITEGSATVRGYVEAHNRVGVLQPNLFSCQYQQDEQGEWRLNAAPVLSPVATGG